jgi:hypothetical protein
MACALAEATPVNLWPPNHKLVRIAIVGVSAPNDPEVMLTVTQVRQDEPVNGLGDGNTSPDAVIQDNGKVLLRVQQESDRGAEKGRVVKRFTVSRSRDHRSWISHGGV